MKKISVKIVDAFTSVPFSGNPAGVVTDASGLTDDEMQRIAYELSCSESAFILKPSTAQSDVCVRFFTPKCEVDLCGHGMIAAFHALVEEKKLSVQNPIDVVKQIPTVFAYSKEGKIQLKEYPALARGIASFFASAHEAKVSLKEPIEVRTAETKAGILPVQIHVDVQTGNAKFVSVVQKKPVIEDLSIEPVRIASALKIKTNEIITEFPLQRVSTGLFTLPVGFSTAACVQKMKPDFSAVEKLCKKYGVGSVHVFTFNTIEEYALVHVRNFAPFLGVHEDPVTGTANGALGCYLIHNKIIDVTGGTTKIVAEQGYELGRKGMAFVEIDSDGERIEEVRVGGQAITTLQGEISIS